MLTTGEVNRAAAHVRALAVAAADLALRDKAEHAQRGRGHNADTLANLDDLAERLAAPVLAVLARVDTSDAAHLATGAGGAGKARRLNGQNGQRPRAGFAPKQ